MTDEQIHELEEKLRTGDENALAALWNEHSLRLERMIQFRLDNRIKGRVDAADILQDAYIDAAKRIGRFASDNFESSFVWMRLIVQQTMTDTFRKHMGAKQRDVRQEIDPYMRGNSPDASVSIALHLLGQASSPSRVVAMDEVFGQIQQAIKQMDPIDQEVLALRHFEEMTNSEVAEALDIQQKAASIRYVRALKRLKGVLSEFSTFLQRPR